MDIKRMETFSDALIAIIMTILVLELTVPQTADLNGLFAVKEQFLAYGLSFLILAIYWVNHHHLLLLADKVDERVLWANNLSLFSVTLLPFATAWLGRNPDSLIPALLYGMVFLSTTITYAILLSSLIKCNGKGSKIYNTLSGDHRSLISISLSVIAVLFAFISPILTPITVFIVAILWFIPTKTIRNIFRRNK